MLCGMNLEATRVNMGLSARAAADAIGIPDHVLRYAETSGRPRLHTALKIAEFYGVQVTDIWPVPAEPRRTAA